MKIHAIPNENDIRYYFKCPACDKIHGLSDKWTFNGDFQKPTFSPSILCTNPQGLHCHSFITDGKIRFEGDSLHDFKGQTLDLPDFPEEYK